MNTKTMCNRNLNEELIAIMVCPMCTEHLYPPIGMCLTGRHNLCPTCYEVLESCPMCKVPLGPLHSFELEKIHAHLTFPCKYKRDGCSMRTKGNKIKQHEKMCIFNPLPEILYFIINGAMQPTRGQRAIFLKNHSSQSKSPIDQISLKNLQL